jgi:Holliday junction resolvasome RuvABC endonuclease subunit
MTIDVMGVDLSLVATGLALPDGTTKTLKNRLTGPARIAYIVDAICDEMQPFSGDLVTVIEGPFIHSKHSRGMLGTFALHGVLEDRLHRAQEPYTFVPPSCLKKYATGSGNAGKSMVLVAAIKRLSYDGADDNEADAAWLRQMGVDWYGESKVQMPQVSREVLTKIDWPSLVVGPF